jgi:hypothetical protein
MVGGRLFVPLPHPQPAELKSNTDAESAVVPQERGKWAQATLKQEFEEHRKKRVESGGIVSVNTAWVAMKEAVHEDVPRAAVETLVRALPDDERAPPHRPKTTKTRLAKSPRQ